jgi:hypothetical protein
VPEAVTPHLHALKADWRGLRSVVAGEQTLPDVQPAVHGFTPLAQHAEGVCAGYPDPTRTGGGGLIRATVAEFERWGVLVDASVYLDHAAVFWTVVPDGVATVTLRFSPDGSEPAHTVTTTVQPINNVVVATEPFDAPNTSGFPSTIVLRDAGGHVIKKTTVTPNMPTVCGYGC